MMIRMEEDRVRGYSVPERGEKFLCSNHFSNPYLRDHIKHNGILGECSYCGSRETVLDLADFVEYIGIRLAEYLEDIDDAGLFLESSFFDDGDEQIPGCIRRCGYIAPEDADFYESNEDAMENFGLIPDSDSLYEDLSSSLYLENKIRRDPTSLLLSDELSILWSQFCNLVKYQQRYTFFKSSLFNDESLLHSSSGLSDILTEVSSLVRRVEDTIPAGIVLYRCRPAKETDSVTGFFDLTSPPSRVAKANRLSPAGISMFYGSFDKETPFTETRNYAKALPLIYRGTFETTKELRVVNLCNMPQISFWMPSGWQEYSFLYQFHKEISKPVAEDDNPDIEYTPSQIFTEYLRYICKSSAGEPYDGIIYQSALTKKKNIVLFFDNKTSAGVLRLCQPIEVISSK